MVYIWASDIQGSLSNLKPWGRSAAWSQELGWGIHVTLGFSFSGLLCRLGLSCLTVDRHISTMLYGDKVADTFCFVYLKSSSSGKHLTWLWDSPFPHEKGFDSEMVGMVPTPSTVAKGQSPCSNTKDDGVMISFFHLNYYLPDYIAEAPGKMTKAQRYLIIVPHNYEHYLSSSLISNVPFPLFYILRSIFSARLIWSMNPCWRGCD